MPSVPPTAEMGRLHEEHAAEIFGGSRSRGSGSTWKDQTDGYNAPDAPFSFRWDCKSTKAQSISVSLATIEKVIEQAQGHRWAIPLRLYANEKLTQIAADLVAVKDTDFSELLDAARTWAELEAALGDVTPEEVTLLLDRARNADRIAGELAQARDSIRILGNTIALQAEDIEAKNTEIAELRARTDGGGIAVPQHMVGFVPQLPWTVIRMAPQNGRLGSAGDPAATVTYYDANGGMKLFTAKTVRVQRSAAGRPQVFQDEVRVRDADVFNPEGKRIARVCENNPSIEEG